MFDNLDDVALRQEQGRQMAAGSTAPDDQNQHP
jgi:hypothetical protein